MNLSSKPNTIFSQQLLMLMKLMLLLVLITSCANDHRPAPVRNLSIEPESRKIWKAGAYHVRKSDTLYSIAFRFGLDFQQLALINQIKRPYTIYPGQELTLRFNKSNSTSSRPSKIASKKPNSNVKPISNKNKDVAQQQNKKTTKQVDNAKSKGIQSNSRFDGKKKVTAWLWPVKNKYWKKGSFGKDSKQGIQISGQIGEAIKASANGRVVYSGNGLVGYGNLIIIKHSQSFLSAYAHNSKLLVSENDVVKAGQKIATMGNNDTGQTELHFEIRYQGRPVNPLKYLPPYD
ncbi:MAG: lipoprotein NlpD [Enterobacterales bacterium]|jgi:lipoprotein NlpD